MENCSRALVGKGAGGFSLRSQEGLALREHKICLFLQSQREVSPGVEAAAAEHTEPYWNMEDNRGWRLRGVIKGRVRGILSRSALLWHLLSNRFCNASDREPWRFHPSSGCIFILFLKPFPKFPRLFILGPEGTLLLFSPKGKWEKPKGTYRFLWGFGDLTL